MSSSIVTNCLRWQLAALLLLTGVAGCGGGDSAGSSSTGSVSVLFSDAPSDEFARINIIVTDIELRGGEHGPAPGAQDPAETLISSGRPGGDIPCHTSVVFLQHIRLLLLTL